MDISIVILLGVAVSSAMKKHGTWKPANGLGDYIGWGAACLFLLAIVRIPIYFLAYGFQFPFPATEKMQAFSGIVAIAFWWAMVYWRIPMRLLGRKP